MNVAAPARQLEMTLADLVAHRGRQQADRVAYVFLRHGEEVEDQLTYGQLDASARACAAELLAAGQHGRNVLLLFGPGLHFMQGLLGCAYAGAVGVPAKVPNRIAGLRRTRAIVDDAGASVVLTTRAVRAALWDRFDGGGELAALRWIEVDSVPAGRADGFVAAGSDPDGPALLQYTSGSTGTPKGVVVTHRNFCRNAAELDELWPATPDDRIVSWLPTFHDMGLMFGAVLPLWNGIPVYLMAPEAFVRRPMRWLEALSRFRGTHTAAPNFAYDDCADIAGAKPPADLDLSSVRVAVSGAEPVRWSTLRRFATTFAPYGFDARALCPGYGLAENTLKVTGTGCDSAPTALWVSRTSLAQGRVEPLAPTDAAATSIVSCGSAHPGTTVRIVDPQTRTPCPPGSVGEIWVAGPCVGAGYWEKAAESAGTFRARLADGAGDGDFLRTGDLGFLSGDELFVTGRIKDLIIRFGRNYYPQDLENSVQAMLGLSGPTSVAAFSVDGDPSERVVVVAEVTGKLLNSRSHGVIVGSIEETVLADHGIRLDDVVIIRRGTLPRTSSGKVQRRACRTQYLEGSLRRADTGRTA